MIEKTLPEAGACWARIAELAYPLESTRPLVTGSVPGAEAPFEAFTDGHTITLRVNRPEELDQDFVSLAAPAYASDATVVYGVPAQPTGEQLAWSLQHDTLLFILFHELFHPTVCPAGPDDERAVSQAILAGLKESRPALSAKELVYCVDNTKNLFWDIVVNTVFVARLARADQGLLDDRIGFVFRERSRSLGGSRVVGLPMSVVPVMYMISAARRLADPLISLVGLFYASLSIGPAATRRRVSQVFLSSLARQGIGSDQVRHTLTDMGVGLFLNLSRERLEAVGVDRAAALASAGFLRDQDGPDYEAHQIALRLAIHEALSRPALRYPALRGLAAALGPYVSVEGKQGSIDEHTKGKSREGDGDERGEQGGQGQQGEGAEDEEERRAGSLARTLEDLEESLGPGGLESVLREISSNPAATDPAGLPGCGGAAGRSEANKGFSSCLSTFAKDALLKRDARAVELRGPAPGLDLVERGRQAHWELKSSQDLSLLEVAGMDLTKVFDIEGSTGLPVMMELTEGIYKLNEFRIVESPVRGWAPRQYRIDVPENWVLLVDSSGSMSGSPYELLLRTTYGIKKGIYEVCRALRKDIKFGVVNFSSATSFSGMDSFVRIFESRTHRVKQTLFSQQGGGTHLEVSVFDAVRKQLAPGRVVFSLVTDGCIDNEAEVLAEIERIARVPENAFLFIEIGSSSALGHQLQALSASAPSILYRNVESVESIRESLSAILIRYSGS